MGLVRQKISLRNPRKPSVPPIEVDALVDSGALHLCIPSTIAERLELDRLHIRKVIYADGRTAEAPYEGPIIVKALGRECYAGALVTGDEVLLGAVPMEDMDLWISPSLQKLVPNPASPDIPMSVAMGFRTLH